MEDLHLRSVRGEGVSPAKFRGCGDEYGGGAKEVAEGGGGFDRTDLPVRSIARSTQHAEKTTCHSGPSGERTRNPVAIKAMFFTTEFIEDTEKTFNLWECPVAI